MSLAPQDRQHWTVEDGQYVWTDTAVGEETLQFELFPELSVDLGDVWPAGKLEEFEGSEAGEKGG